MDTDTSKNLTVTELKTAIDTLFEELKDSQILGKIYEVIDVKYEYEKDEIITGLLYYYVIEHLSSSTKTIWAYQDKLIDLPIYLEGKMYILRNWDHIVILNMFAEFIKNLKELQQLKDTYGIEGTINTYSHVGRDWIQKLLQDEQNILELNLTVANTDLKNEINKLTTTNQELFEQTIKDEYDRVKKLVRDSPDKYDQILIRFEEIASREKGCRFKNGKINKAAIIEFIHRLTKKQKSTIKKRLERHLISKGQLPPRI